jgi:hypothetical protein
MNRPTKNKHTHLSIPNIAILLNPLTPTRTYIHEHARTYAHANVRIHTRMHTILNAVCATSFPRFSPLLHGCFLFFCCVGLFLIGNRFLEFIFKFRSSLLGVYFYVLGRAKHIPGILLRPASLFIEMAHYTPP